MSLWVFSGAMGPDGATGLMLHIPMCVFLVVVSKIQPSIHPSIFLWDIESQGSGGATQDCHWRKAGWRPGKVASLSQGFTEKNTNTNSHTHTHTHTNRQFRVPSSCVFLDCWGYHRKAVETWGERAGSTQKGSRPRIELLQPLSPCLKCQHENHAKDWNP